MIGRLTDALSERERSEARLREFVADASHELRTPLTTVLGYAQLYRKGALSRKAEQARCLGPHGGRGDAHEAPGRGHAGTRPLRRGT